MQRLGGDLRVRTLVTLGTPHSGTAVVPLANAHPIVRQMRPGSPVIEELARFTPGCRTHFVSFWSDLDHLMEPLETACVDHPDLITQNVQVSGIGHLALPVHPAVATGIRQALDTPRPEARLSHSRRRPDSGLTGDRQRAHSPGKIERYSNPRPNPCPPSPETRPNARFLLTRNLTKIVVPAYCRVQSTALLWQPLLSRRIEKLVNDRHPSGTMTTPAPASDATSAHYASYGGQDAQYGDFTTYGDHAATGFQQSAAAWPRHRELRDRPPLRRHVGPRP